MNQIEIRQFPLMTEEKIVHFPKLAQHAGGLRRLRRSACSWMNRALREMSEYKPQSISESFTKLTNNRLRIEAIRTFIVAVLDNSDWRIGTPKGMLLLRNRHGKVRDIFSIIG